MKRLSFFYKIFLFLLVFDLVFVVGCYSLQNGNIYPKWWNNPSASSGGRYVAYVSARGRTQGEAQASALSKAVSSIESELDISLKNIDFIDVFTDEPKKNNDVIIENKTFNKIADGIIECLMCVAVEDGTILKLNTILGQTRIKSREKVEKLYNDAIEAYKKYEDTKAISLILQAALEADRAKIFTGGCSRDVLMEQACRMLSRMELNVSSFDSSTLSCVVTVIRHANISPDYIKRADFSVSVSDDEGKVLYTVDNVTDDRGVMSLKLAARLIGVGGIFKVNFDFDIRRSDFDNFGNTELRDRFFNLYQEKSYSVAFKYVDKRQVVIFNILADDKAKAYNEANFENRVKNVASRYENLTISNYTWSLNLSKEEVLNKILENELYRSYDIAVIAVAEVDSIKRFESCCILHASVYFCFYDLKSKSMIKQFDDFECVGMGKDEADAYKSLSDKYADMLGRYTIDIISQ